jgi:hypothetical protein
MPYTICIKLISILSSPVYYEFQDSQQLLNVSQHNQRWTDMQKVVTMRLFVMETFS